MEEIDIEKDRKRGGATGGEERNRCIKWRTSSIVNAVS